MNLSEYLRKTKGTGVLATSDSDGNIDVAIYSLPYVIEENKIAFSMLERTSYANIQSNPKACYIFIEKGQGYNGRRLYLKMVSEETDLKVIEEIKSQHIRRHQGKTDQPRHFIYFSIEKTRPLID